MFSLQTLFLLLMMTSFIDCQQQQQGKNQNLPVKAKAQQGHEGINNTTTSKNDIIVGWMLISRLI